MMTMIMNIATKLNSQGTPMLVACDIVYKMIIIASTPNRVFVIRLIENTRDC